MFYKLIGGEEIYFSIKESIFLFLNGFMYLILYIIYKVRKEVLKSDLIESC